MSNVTLAQDSALDVAKTLRGMAGDLRSRGANLEDFAFLIEEMVRNGSFINNTFVSNVIRTASSALMMNNNLGSLQSALYSATAAVQYQADGR